MIDRLLIVPDSLSHESFPGWGVVGLGRIAAGDSSRPSWPCHRELQRLVVEHRCSAVAVTSESNVQAVQRMVAALQNTATGNAGQIVFAEEAIPSDLRSTFPPALFPALQRVLPRDLISLTADVIRDTMSNESMPAAALRHNRVSSCIPACPLPDRFPEAGPAACGKNIGLSAGLISTVVQNALVEMNPSTADQRCLTAGILLLWDFLDESHEISQTMEGRGTPKTGDYWHGIMHRREPDAGNASYWFQRLGRHPAFDPLSRHLDRWLQETGASDEERSLATGTLNAKGQFDPFALIELSTRAIRRPGQLEDSTLRRVQYLEILNLLSTGFEAGPSRSGNDVRGFDAA